MNAKRRRPETYEATYHGKKVRVTVPERHESVAYSGDAAEALRDVLRDNLSPHAVAAIAAFLQPARPSAGRTGNTSVDRELRWFADQLVELLGGADAFNLLCNEVGL